MTPDLQDVRPETVISLPFQGRWLAENSPARRVPSHGTDLLGSRYAIDFTAVDERRRSAERRDWRTLFSTEPVDRFIGFGRPILAPGDGIVVRVHDGEPDHEARRSRLSLLRYALGQPARLRRGVVGVAGNHVVIALRHGGVFIALAHLKSGSIRVAVGQAVIEGQPIADCGNSGNSTQPHVHIQAMDAADASVARGIPMTFRRFRESPRGTKQYQVRDRGVPAEGAVVENPQSS